VEGDEGGTGYMGAYGRRIMEDYVKKLREREQPAALP